MSIGWVGLGKLGAPCAAALSFSGNHAVWGYDVRGVDPDSYDWGDLPPIELCDSVGKVVGETDDVVFVAVQTPHSPAYGGEMVAPDEPREFEYAYLINAVRQVCRQAMTQQKNITLVVVSTVLPGTFDRYLRPLLNEYVTPVYHPFFIAMGTVVQDFIEPELTLFGVDHESHAKSVHELYRPIHNAPAPMMSIASAELTKVAYNTYISMKIVFANTMGEMCEATGADVDDVSYALSFATQRIMSNAYLRAGMGDGGACHPRDNVALSALAQRHGLSVDLMGFLTRAREAQTRRLAELVAHWELVAQKHVVVLGTAYKPNVQLVDGSPALLLAEYLRELNVKFTHVDNIEQIVPSLSRSARVFVIATAHDEFAEFNYPAGSIVIDPFGIMSASSDIMLVTPGRKR
jgi:UDPglucose 6-dehydrogenase